MKTIIIKNAIVVFIIFVAVSCKNSQQQDTTTTVPTETTNNELPKTPQITAQEIVDQAIAYYGGANFEQAEINFKFRDYEYRSIQNGGQYQLERIQYNKAIGKITDEVTNSGYRNVLNDEFAIDIVDSMKIKKSNSVNSVHYFARLPYGLNAPAVNKKLLGIDSINGTAYYQVKVTFDQEGGGVDHEDEFMYWFNTSNFQMDYLAYSYQTDGGGIRFRAAKNLREVNGIKFQDYINYKPETLAVALEDLSSKYESGALEEVSQIILENLKVDLLNEQ